MDSSPAENAPGARASRCAILIPAYDEAETVARVVRAARAAQLGPVWVIDDGSRDGTGAAARAAGAEVLRLERNRGKGGAVVAGARAVDAEVLVLLDADLIGLTPEHLKALAEPVLCGEAEMTRGMFVGGRMRTSAAQRLAPQLNGQRAVLRRRLGEVAGLATSGYGIEVVLTEAARRGGWRRVDVPMPGVSQVMKEEKRGWWRGVRTRLAMYREIVRALMGGRHG